MQNTFSQSGNDSKWFLKKSFFKIGMWHSRPPRDPPPFMANAILNFHFDFLTPSLNKEMLIEKMSETVTVFYFLPKRSACILITNWLQLLLYEILEP